MIMIIGSHVSFKKDQLLDSVKEAISYNANTFMFYTGAPQNTMRSKLDDEKTKEALKLMKENNIDINNVVCHAPYIVNLANNKELEKYRDLSYKISKHCFYNDEDDLEIDDAAKVLLIQRARVVAGAKNKIYKLRELIANYVTEDHILIYCGATKDMDIISDVSERDVEGERQIVSVSKMLGLDFGMKVTHFTSSESSIERELIKKQFADRDPYQALVAIKCLDEGVNIPSIKTAFILASSTNPKEYIQRRGRVLRLYKDKKYATIYDFVTLPKELEKVDFSSEEAHYDYSLITKEITRMKEFGRISLNPSDSDRLIKILEETYGLDRFNGKEFIYG